MPQISEQSVEEHIRKQTELLLDASAKLFRKNGYLNTDMSDIAQAMGLARNSLYRYYPNKDHILVACIKRALEPHIEQENKILEEHDDPFDRLSALIDEQLAFSAGPDHIAAGFLDELRSASPELRKEIKALHEQMQAVLKLTVEEIVTAQGRDPEIVSSLVLGMIQAATGVNKTDKKAVADELKRSIRAMLE